MLKEKEDKDEKPSHEPVSLNMTFPAPGKDRTIYITYSQTSEYQARRCDHFIYICNDLIILNKFIIK